VDQRCFHLFISWSDVLYFVITHGACVTIAGSAERALSNEASDKQDKHALDPHSQEFKDGVESGHARPPSGYRHVIGYHLPDVGAFNHAAPGGALI